MLSRLTNEHIFLGFAHVEWDTFSQAGRDLGSIRLATIVGSSRRRQF